MSIAFAPSPPRKHWVYAIGRDIKEKAEMMITIMQSHGKSYEFIKPNEIGKIKPEDVLYVHCHGSPASGETNNEQRMWIDKDGKGRKTEKVDAREFAAWLENKGLLGQNLHFLKLAACHSDEFSKELYSCLKDRYPNLTIYGYKDELVVCQGKNFGKLAGLKPPLIDDTRTGHPVVPTEIEKPGIKEQYRAKAQRVSNGPKIQATRSNPSSSSSSSYSHNSSSSSSSYFSNPSSLPLSSDSTALENTSSITSSLSSEQPSGTSLSQKLNAVMSAFSSLNITGPETLSSQNTALINSKNGQAASAHSIRPLSSSSIASNTLTISNAPSSSPKTEKTQALQEENDKDGETSKPKI